jgi:hypothetical protein
VRTVEIDVRPLTRNVTRAYRAASEEHRTQGREWYAHANRLARELDPNNVERAAAVIAVLSPRVSWDFNAYLAAWAYAVHGMPGKIHPLAHPKVLARTAPTIKGHAEKAFRILNGGNADAIVSGPKVRAFWRAIISPLSTDVVIDRHAVDIACGRVLDERTRNVILSRKGGYEAAQACYLRAAGILSRELGRTVTPCEVQATTWLHWRAAKKAKTDD